MGERVGGFSEKKMCCVSALYHLSCQQPTLVTSETFLFTEGDLRDWACYILSSFYPLP